MRINTSSADARLEGSLGEEGISKGLLPFHSQADFWAASAIGPVRLTFASRTLYLSSGCKVLDTLVHHGASLPAGATASPPPPVPWTGAAVRCGNDPPPDTWLTPRITRQSRKPGDSSYRGCLQCYGL